jgi:hypothetical protein
MIRKPSAADVTELEWFKSSYSSSGDGNDCVEMAATPGAVRLRDSKKMPGPQFAVTPAAWADFVLYLSEN